MIICNRRSAAHKVLGRRGKVCCYGKLQMDRALVLMYKEVISAWGKNKRKRI
jgi:hypothetical protein